LRNKRIALFLLIFLILGLAAFSTPVLRGWGRFLAPHGVGNAEAVLVEGFQVIQGGMMEAALALVRQGRAGRIIVVLHDYPEKERLFAIQDQYLERLGEELECLGLTRDQYRIWIVPINDHPITQTEARSVVPRLAQAGIRRAFLLCRGFHTRRSFLVYQNLGAPLGIRFIPLPYFPSYDQDSWWRHPEGLREFGAQTLKLGYYLAMGYIPISSLFHSIDP
jgi:hypothetical protein